LEEARGTLRKSKEEMAHYYYNRQRTPAPEYKPGDKVFLDASDIKTMRPSQKLGHHFLVPYPIVQQVGRSAYRLALPHALSCIHPVFNVVKLKPAPEDPIVRHHVPPPPEPVLMEGEPEFEVEKVLDSWMHYQKLQFLVSWKGYGREENAWVNEKDLHEPELVTEFYQENPGAPRQVHRLCQDLTRSLMPRRGGDVRGHVGMNPFQSLEWR
jgi:hypothetical protein